MTLLTTDQLDGLLTAQTLYLDTPAGEAAIHFAESGESHARLPGGDWLTGRWRLLDAAYAVDWENGPQDSRTQVRRAAQVLSLSDAATGAPRGQITRIVPGNPEGF